MSINNKIKTPKRVVCTGKPDHRLQCLREHASADHLKTFLHVALFLRYHSQNEQNDVTGGVESVQVLLFEENLNGWITLFQLPDPADTVQQVSGKPADRLCDDHVDLSRHGVFHHEPESRPMFCIGAGKAIIHIGADVLPFRIGLDLSLSRIRH